MLSSGTAEANGQITEATFHISLHRSIYQRIDRVEETENFTIFFEKTDHRFVQSRERFVTFVLTGIVQGPAAKALTAAITGRIIGNPFLISKTHHFDGKLPFLEIVGELLEFGKFA